MMATSPPVERQPNPFALPPETNARFALLVVAALSLTFLSGLVIVFAVGLAQASPETAINISSSTDAGFLADAKALGLAGVAFHLLRIAFPFALVTLVLFVALVRYRRHPARVCRQHNLGPLDSDKGHKLKQEVLKMAAGIGLHPVPKIVSNPNIRSQDAQAFGLPKRYIIRLGDGWRLGLVKNPQIFQAVLCHEMGHIINGDVRHYYFTEALWHATRFYGLLPMTAVLSFLLLQALGDRLLNLNNDWMSFFTVNLPSFLAVGVQIGVVWLITEAIHASVLRVREYYADARANLWGAREGLRMILQPKERVQSLSERIRDWWELHPTPAERLATVDDPEQLFKFSLDLPFIVGFLIAIVSFGAFSLFVNLATGLGFALIDSVAQMMEMAEARTSYLLLVLAVTLLILLVLLSAILLFLPVFAISYLMSNVLGLQLIREGLYFQVTGRVRNGRYKQFALITLLWLLGLELGFLILPMGSNALSPFVSLYPGGDFWRVFSMIVWWICTGILIWLWLLFSHQVGIRWLGHDSGITIPRWRLRIISTMTSGVLWLFLIPIAASRVLILSGSSSDAAPFLVVIALSLVAGLFLYGLLWISTWIFGTKIDKFNRFEKSGGEG